jgi:hypothetical protein
MAEASFLSSSFSSLLLFLLGRLFLVVLVVVVLLATTTRHEARRELGRLLTGLLIHRLLDQVELLNVGVGHDATELVALGDLRVPVLHLVELGLCRRCSLVFRPDRCALALVLGFLALSTSGFRLLAERAVPELLDLSIAQLIQVDAFSAASLANISASASFV